MSRTEPRKRNLDPTVIRTGDFVRIVEPRVVVRVGYPKCLKDYVPEAEALFLPALRKALDDSKKVSRHALAKDGKSYKRIVYELAWMLARANGFGGYTRMLHFEEEPELKGRVCQVFAVRSVHTGERFAPSGSGEDYEPGGLENRKTHRLVEVFVGLASINRRGTELPTSHVEKVVR